MLYVYLENLLDSIDKFFELFYHDPDAYESFLGAKFPSDLEKIRYKIEEFLGDLDNS